MFYIDFRSVFDAFATGWNKIKIFFLYNGNISAVISWPGPGIMARTQSTEPVYLLRAIPATSPPFSPAQFFFYHIWAHFAPKSRIPGPKNGVDGGPGDPRGDGGEGADGRPE